MGGRSGPSTCRPHRHRAGRRRLVGGAAAPEAVASVEGAPGVRLPASFRSLLLLAGGGGPRGFRVSSVNSAAPLAVQRGAVYGDTLQYREPWVPHALPPHLAVVQRCPNDNEPFCLDTAKWSGDECPVVLYSLHSGRVERVAPDFLAFWGRYLAPQFEAAVE